MTFRTKTVGLLVAASLPLGHTQTGRVGGDACLPRDVISLLRGEKVAAVAANCVPQEESSELVEVSCNPACGQAVAELKSERCFPYLTQPQHLQSRLRRTSLVAMSGTWYGLYPASGVELLEMVYNASTGVLSATKLTGNQYVRAGRVSWEATPSPCRVVSSLWANAYTPRWDPCTLTMWPDAMAVDLGEEEHELRFVRAKARHLFAWDDPRASTFRFAEVFDACGVSVAPSWWAELASELSSTLHHSHSTVVLDQILLFLPALLIGGWQLSAARHQKWLVLGAAAYAYVLTSRLQEMGYLS